MGIRFIEARVLSRIWPRGHGVGTLPFWSGRATALDEDLFIPFIPVDSFSFSLDAGPIVHFRIQGMSRLAEAFPEIREEPKRGGRRGRLREGGSGWLTFSSAVFAFSAVEKPCRDGRSKSLRCLNGAAACLFTQIREDPE